MWKDIEAYEGLYSVSSTGDVWSYPKIWVSNKGGINKHNGKILKSPLASEGYPSVSLSKNKEPKNYMVHILVAKAFIPNPQNLKFVNHKDGNKQNNRVDNLEWCTRIENENHALLNGLKPKGDTHGASKLKEVDVIEILKMNSNGISQTTIAKQFNIRQATISCIVLGKTWKHLKKTY